MSIISYGASVWGCKRFSCVSAVQNRALRSFLGVGRYTPNAAVQGDTGWGSAYQKQRPCIMNQWCRIKNMEQSRLNHKIYRLSVNHGNFRHKNWAHRIKVMMENGNIGDIFGQVSWNINKAYIMRHINEHIKTQENATWLNEISRQEVRRGNGPNKLRTYKLLKNNYAKETYVQILMQRTHRSAYVKFRMGIVPLLIETGRYERLEEENRLATLQRCSRVWRACFVTLSPISRPERNFVYKDSILYTRLLF